MKTRLLAAVVAACLGMPAAHAAIIPVNEDAPGVGLNDPTARAPEGGNPGTTVGDPFLFRKLLTPTIGSSPVCFNISYCKLSS